MKIIIKCIAEDSLKYLHFMIEINKSIVSTILDKTLYI